MTPLFISVLLAAVCLECRAQKDNVLQPKGDETAAEGDTVTPDCQYEASGTNPTLFWYKQDGNNSPKFILSRFSRDEGNTADEFKERFSSTLDSKDKSVPLKIQKLQLSDSAVYYCALRPATGGFYKIVFGSGTRLTVEPRTKYEPAYFKVGEGDNSACLATGFSRHNATTEHEKYGEEFKKTKAVAISPNLDLYNQVIFLKDDGSGCGGGGAKTCTDTLVPDEKVNLMSLTILGLRVIFIKTIIFNILLTLRLWISQ